MSRLLLIIAGLLIATTSADSQERCLECHEGAAEGHISAHRFGDAPCTTCHEGDGGAEQVEQAHDGLIAFPGNLDNVARTCGKCHGAQLAGVIESPMHRGGGMVRTTREALGEVAQHPQHHDLQSLGHGPADSMLRKLCASCHLGQRKLRHGLDVTRDRGGGCLACHVNAYPEGAHPRIDARVEDGRCFGCHSRSGRIALNYPGLAETDAQLMATDRRYARLQDGRLVERAHSDAHHRAGMACIDCHTGRGLMGQTQAHAAGPDIACSDCHANTNPRITLTTWPDGQRDALAQIPFHATSDQAFLTTGQGTPLQHVEVTGDGLRLHLKLQRRSLTIPQIQEEHFPLADSHQRLSCDACHAQWAPQCHGCHMEYDPSEWQWDHVERAFTPGTWHERRWDVRHGAPTLGVDDEDRIVPVVPGMIMTVEHPDWKKPRFVRSFAALSPHTTGQARSCESCHRSSMAVGLGSGRLEIDESALSFHPSLDPGPDDLPADAWTSLGSPYRPPSGAQVQPFEPADIRRILSTPLEGKN